MLSFHYDPLPQKGSKWNFYLNIFNFSKVIRIMEDIVKNCYLDPGNEKVKYLPAASRLVTNHFGYQSKVSLNL